MAESQNTELCETAATSGVGLGGLRGRIQAYFEDLCAAEPEPNPEERVRWRTHCFDQGVELVRFIERTYFPMQGKRALDVACGWGGHALALSSGGAEVYAADLNDFAHARLTRFIADLGLNIHVLQGDCQKLPFHDASFDVVLGLELVEHIPDPDMFASEVGRVLAPGGICVVSTPAKLRSIVWGEPHFGLRGLAALPFRLQRPLATKVFGRQYPFPITRQYVTARQVIRPFAKTGMIGRAWVRGKGEHVASSVPAARGFLEQFAWELIVLQKPTTAPLLNAGE